MPPRRTRAEVSPTPEPTPVELPPIKSGASRPSPIIIGLIVLVVLAGIGYAAKMQFFNKTAASEAAATTPNDVKDLVAKLAKHMLVNETAAPSVAIVSDADLLRQQRPDFYKDAQNGDRLVLWSDKAVLYSPSRDLILAVLPLNAADSSPTTAPAAATAPQPAPAAATTTAEAPPEPEKATIEVRNGSGVTGRAKEVVTKLRTLGLTAPTAKDATSKTPYAHTLIIKVSNKDLPKTGSALTGLLGGSVSAMSAAPAEAATTADFLVIVGQDYQP